MISAIAERCGAYVRNAEEETWRITLQKRGGWSPFLKHGSSDQSLDETVYGRVEGVSGVAAPCAWYALWGTIVPG